MGLLPRRDRSRSHKGSYVGENNLFEEMVLSGKLELELIPQGTLAERIRAGGAGIPAFFTPTGVGTMVAEGKETREFDGRHYLMERWLRADFALVKAWKGDRLGKPHLSQDGAQLQSDDGHGGEITIAEVEELVSPANSIPTRSIPPASTCSASSSPSAKKNESSAARAQGQT